MHTHQPFLSSRNGFLIVAALLIVSISLLALFIYTSGRHFHSASSVSGGGAKNEQQTASSDHPRHHGVKDEEENDHDQQQLEEAKRDRREEEAAHVRQLEENLVECRNELERNQQQQEQRSTGHHHRVEDSALFFYCGIAGACSGHGACDTFSSSALHASPSPSALLKLHQRPGTCKCEAGWTSKDCSLPVGGGASKNGINYNNNNNNNDDQLHHHLLSQVSVVCPDANIAATFSRFSSALEVLSVAGEDDHLDHHRGDVDSVNSLIAKATRPLILILGPDIDKAEYTRSSSSSSSGGNHCHRGEGAIWRLNIPEMVRQMKMTDVDFLGAMIIEGSSSTSSSSKAVRGHFDPFCNDFVYHSWQLRHKRAPYGYERHQNFVMYCDRVSNTFMVRRSLLHLDFSKQQQQQSKNNYIGRALNASFIGGGTGGENDLWPLCSFHAEKKCRLFDEKLLGRNVAPLDLFLRLRRFNDALTRSHGLLMHSQQQQSSPVCLQVLVGACAESIVSVVHRKHFVEQLTPQFSERHQVEVYFDAFSRRSNIVCVKAGGIYGHSRRGLVAPLCHRLSRQRDFLWIANSWIYGQPVRSTSSNKRHQEDDDDHDEDVNHNDDHDDEPKYSVSVHHGNLFGALRIQEELLWETDGDFDLIGHRSSHNDLLDRMKKLVAAAEKRGFEIVITYPEKPWYIAFKRDGGRTDFQINARSPRSTQTRGKPPQEHNVTISYQGRRVFMNGFANPWKSVRLDPGHDYRELYLAQQGWVLHFTKDSVSCGVEGHNACLPDCRASAAKQDYRGRRDHEWCSDDEMSLFARNPILWFDKESTFYPPKMPQSDKKANASSGNNNYNNNNNLGNSNPDNSNNKQSRGFDETELELLSRGEARRWMKEHLWRFL